MRDIAQIPNVIASAAVREDLPHIRVRICGPLKIIEVLAGG